MKKEHLENSVHERKNPYLSKQKAVLNYETITIFVYTYMQVFERGKKTRSQISLTQNAQAKYFCPKNLVNSIFLARYLI